MSSGSYDPDKDQPGVRQSDGSSSNMASARSGNHGNVRQGPNLDDLIYDAAADAGASGSPRRRSSSSSSSSSNSSKGSGRERKPAPPGYLESPQRIPDPPRRPSSEADPHPAPGASASPPPGTPPPPARGPSPLQDEAAARDRPPSGNGPGPGASPVPGTPPTARDPSLLSETPRSALSPPPLAGSRPTSGRPASQPPSTAGSPSPLPDATLAPAGTPPPQQPGPGRPPSGGVRTPPSATPPPLDAAQPSDSPFPPAGRPPSGTTLPSPAPGTPPDRARSPLPGTAPAADSAPSPPPATPATALSPSASLGRPPSGSGRSPAPAQGTPPPIRSPSPPAGMTSSALFPPSSRAGTPSSLRSPSPRPSTPLAAVSASPPPTPPAASEPGKGDGAAAAAAIGVLEAAADLDSSPTSTPAAASGDATPTYGSSPSGREDVDGSAGGCGDDGDGGGGPAGRESRPASASSQTSRTAPPLPPPGPPSRTPSASRTTPPGVPSPQVSKAAVAAAAAAPAVAAAGAGFPAQAAPTLGPADASRNAPSGEPTQPHEKQRHEKQPDEKQPQQQQPHPSGGKESSPHLQELRDKAQAICLLSPQTRAWLHVNKYGIPLKPGAKAEEAGGQEEDDDLYDESSWKSIIQMYRGAIWQLMTDPDSSRAAYVVSMLIMVTILLSTLAFCLETVPAYSEERSPVSHRAFVVIEAVTVQIFLADYLLRLLCCPALLPFLLSPLNIIDLVSIVPWYVELAMEDSGMEGTAVFRVLRLLRVFRVLKLGGRYRKLLVVTSSLAASVDMLLLVAFFVSLVVVLAATFMYFAERGSYDEALGYYVRKNEKYLKADGEPIVSPFESIPAGFWWAIVTVMTVGYGDTVPITVGGRFIACATMICGILAVALPVAVIGSNFAAAWEAYLKQRRRGDGAAEVSPQLRALEEVLIKHTATAAELEGVLEQSVRRLSDLRARFRERSDMRRLEVEALVRQWSDGLSPRQVEAVRDIVACLARLGAGLGEAPPQHGYGYGYGFAGALSGPLEAAVSGVLDADWEGQAAEGGGRQGEQGRQAQQPQRQEQGQEGGGRAAAVLPPPSPQQQQPQQQHQQVHVQEEVSGAEGAKEADDVRISPVHPSALAARPSHSTTLPPTASSKRATFALPPDFDADGESEADGAGGGGASSSPSGPFAAASGAVSRAQSSVSGLPQGVIMLRAISARSRRSVTAGASTPSGAPGGGANRVVPTGPAPDGASRGSSGTGQAGAAAVAPPPSTPPAAAPVPAEAASAAAPPTPTPSSVVVGGGRAGGSDGGSNVRHVWGPEQEEEPESSCDTAAQLTVAFEALRGSPLHDRMLREVKEALELEEELRRRRDNLVRVLKSCALMASGLLPEAVDLMRSQYRQLSQLRREVSELHYRLDLLRDLQRSLERDVDRGGREVVMDMVAVIGGATKRPVITAAAGTGGKWQRRYGAKRNAVAPAPPGVPAVLEPDAIATKAALAKLSEPPGSPDGGGSGSRPVNGRSRGLGSADGHDDDAVDEGDLIAAALATAGAVPPPPPAALAAAFDLSPYAQAGSDVPAETPVATPLPRVSVLPSRAVSRAASRSAPRSPSD